MGVTIIQRNEKKGYHGHYNTFFLRLNYEFSDEKAIFKIHF